MQRITGERIRYKIGASKKLGMWMGGNVPLGYLPSGRTLTVDPAQAETVRMIFRRYLELGSVHVLRQELDETGVRSKVTTSKAGVKRGGTPLNRGTLFHILRNRVYLGQIPHKDLTYPGQHPAIVDVALFEAVQAKLDETALKPGTEAARRTRRTHKGAPLTGLIFDSAANPMSPVSCPRKSGVTYRYYVSQAVQTGVRQRAGSCPRASAPIVEELVLDRLVRLGLAERGISDWTEARAAIDRVEVSDRGVRLTLGAGIDDSLGDQHWVERRVPADVVSTNDASIVIEITARMARSRGGNVAVGPDGLAAVQHARTDTTLTSALIRAEAWKRQLMEGRAPNLEAIAKGEDVTAAYAAKLIRVAFLAPDLKRAIIEGRQPAGLNLQRVLTREVPLQWDDTRRARRLPTVADPRSAAKSEVPHGVGGLSGLGPGPKPVPSSSSCNGFTRRTLLHAL